MAQSKPTLSDVSGRLVVSAQWDDTRHTPATNVYIEAHGYVIALKASKSFILQPTAPGTYEAKLPPAVYDVFISDGISMPVCKRVEVTSHNTISWQVRLDMDLRYTRK